MEFLLKSALRNSVCPKRLFAKYWVGMMTEQQIASELIDFYKWCIYHNLTLPAEVNVLGYSCPLSVLKSECEITVVNNMKRLW